MSDNITEYTVTDEDGDALIVRYVSRSCKCSLDNCNDDTIELHEPGDEIPYRQNIIRGEISWLIEGLLDGTYKVEKEVEQ